MVSLFKKHPRNTGRHAKAGVDDPPVSKFLRDPAGNCLLDAEFHHPEAVQGPDELAGNLRAVGFRRSLQHVGCLDDVIDENSGNVNVKGSDRTVSGNTSNLRYDDAPAISGRRRHFHRTEIRAFGLETQVPPLV